jgi:membrane protein
MVQVRKLKRKMIASQEHVKSDFIQFKKGWTIQPFFYMVLFYFLLSCVNIMKNQLKKFWSISYRTYEVVNKHHGTLFAKTLSFQTLFCIFPAILTLVGLAGYFHFFSESINQFQSLSSEVLPKAILSKLLPQIESALENVKSAAIGILTIFLAASFSLVSHILEIFYRFAEQEENPNLKKQIFAYILFILFTLVYIALGASVLYFLSNHNIDMPQLLFRYINFFMFAIIIFSFYFLLSPINLKKINILWVSLIIASLITLIQRLFVIYLMWFPGYMLIYGTLAFIPLFFFWLYIFWTIFLYGYAFLLVITGNSKKIET